MSTRDPARFGLRIVSAALGLVVGVLLGVQLFDGHLLLGLVGAFDFVVSIPLLVLAIRGFRRERASAD